MQRLFIRDLEFHTAVDDIAFQSVQTGDLLVAAAVAEILLCDCPEGISVRYGMNAIVLGGFRASHGKCRGFDWRHDGVPAGLVLVNDRAVAADLYHIPAELLNPAGNGFAVIVGAARDGHEVTDLDRPGGLGGFGRLYITAESCRDLGCKIAHAGIHPVAGTALVRKPSVDGQHHLVGFRGVVECLGLIAQPERNISSKDKQKLTFYFKRSKNMIEQYEPLKQQEIVSQMRHFVRFYEFLLQVSCFEDTDLHKKYNFITYLLAYINIKHPGGGYNLDGKIKATNFVQKKAEEHTNPKLVAQPVVKLPTAESFGLTEAKEERLSQIIAEINSRTGKAYDNDVAVKAMLQIRDILMKSDKLKTSARNNTVKDFEFSYFDDIDDALIEGLEQNQDFFSLLLSNDEIKKQVLGIFTEEIYKSLREA